MPETVAEILKAYRTGDGTPPDIVARSFARLRAHDDPAMFINLCDEKDVIAEAQALARGGDKSLPLYGIPVAVKDNIDVAGLSTTAACPAFLYSPGKDATAVARLRAAGALVIGKTNLDQFATGLVGVRSPYGIGRNLFDDKLIPGGSSTGSALAVGAGIVALSLGTDTAGSGRVPAAYSNIVGLKPSLGLVSTAGVVPACRTLDCVSVFALTVDDAMTALKAIAGPDEADPYSRPRAMNAVGAMPNGVRLGVPSAGQRMFFGDKGSAAAYDAALAKLSELGANLVEIDMEPFYETARLLYEGPWVAERYLAAKSLIDTAPEALHPVTRQIIAAGARATAADAFKAFYRLEALRRIRDRTFGEIDATGAADRADHLYDRTGARRTDRTQQPARHLHEFRQSARSVRACRAGVDATRRHAVRDHALGARRRRRLARVDRPRIPSQERSAARCAQISPTGLISRRITSRRSR